MIDLHPQSVNSLVTNKNVKSFKGGVMVGRTVKVKWVEMFDLENDSYEIGAWFAAKEAHTPFWVFRFSCFLVVYDKPTTVEEACQDWTDYMVVIEDDD